MHPGSRWVHPGYSLGCALGCVGFIRGRSVQSRAPLGLLSSSSVVGFTQMRAGDRWIHSGAN